MAVYVRAGKLLWMGKSKKRGHWQDPLNRPVVSQSYRRYSLVTLEDGTRQEHRVQPVHVCGRATRPAGSAAKGIVGIVGYRTA